VLINFYGKRIIAFGGHDRIYSTIQGERIETFIDKYFQNTSSNLTFISNIDIIDNQNINDTIPLQERISMVFNTWRNSYFNVKFEYIRQNSIPLTRYITNYLNNRYTNINDIDTDLYKIVKSDYDAENTDIFYQLDNPDPDSIKLEYLRLLGYDGIIRDLYNMEEKKQDSNMQKYKLSEIIHNQFIEILNDQFDDFIGHLKYLFDKKDSENIDTFRIKLESIEKTGEFRTFIENFSKFINMITACIIIIQLMLDKNANILLCFNVETIINILSILKSISVPYTQYGTTDVLHLYKNNVVIPKNIFDFYNK